MFCPSRSTVPRTRVPSIRSFIRLRTRRKVDLPHPDGPMNAVTDREGIDSVMSKSAWTAPYHNDRSLISNLTVERLKSADSRPPLLRSEMIVEYASVVTRLLYRGCVWI